jgi:membrane fusion protein
MHLPHRMTLAAITRGLLSAAARLNETTRTVEQPPARVDAASTGQSDVPERPRLFRSEVLREHQAQWLGTVLLTPRLSHRIFAWFAALTAAAVISLLYFGDFTRKARVSGWLIPEAGLVRVFAPRTGVVVALHVREGQQIRKGAPLLTLSDELQSARLGAIRAEIARRLAERRDSLLQEQLESQRLFEQQEQLLTARLAMLRAEEKQIAREISLQTSRVALAKRAEVRQREIRRLGYIPEQQLQQAEETKLEQVARLVALERDRLNTLRERLTLEGELKELPVKAKAQIAAHQRSIASVEQELAESEALREIIIPAPQDGTVTAIQAEAGGRAATNVPLLSIVPSGAELQAHLYSPSRAVGFVRPGQRVFLRYQAYPYQKFGQYNGVVVSISRSALSPSELPSQLSALATLNGTNEPVYRIAVRLESQAVTAYGKQLPLQPGMQLEADVALERRRLYEWVLDPLYTITGKWHG